MEKIKIDLSDVVAEVKKLGAENPGFVYDAYNNCSYVAQRGEGLSPCIVGQALQNLGVPDSVLQAEESKLNDLNEFGDSSVGEFLDPDRWNSIFEVTYAYGELSYLGTVQSRQDNRVPWGEAVAA